MQRIYKVMVILLGMATHYSFAQQQEHNFTITPEQPTPGATIQIQYNPAGTPLAEKDTITGRLYAYCGFEWYGYDLAMAKHSQGWEASFTLPNQASLITCVFVADTLKDYGGQKTYTWMLSDERGARCQGAFIGWATLRKPVADMALPVYHNPEATITDEVVMFWIKQELMYYPQSRRNVFYPAMFILKEEGKAEPAHQELQYILSMDDVTELEMMKVAEAYRRVLVDPVRADSVEKRILEKYPQGNLPKLQAWRSLQHVKNAAEGIARAARFLEQYPPAKADLSFDRLVDMYYARVYQAAIAKPLMEKNYEALTPMIAEAPYDVLALLYYKAIIVAHKTEYLSDKELLPYAAQIIQRYEYFQQHRPEAYQYMAPEEWARKVDKDLISVGLLTHITILRNAGRYDEALAYATFAQQQLQYKDAELNDNQAFLLDRAGQSQKLQHVMEQSLYENQSTPWILHKMKTIYVKAHPDADGFEQYIQSLKNEAHQTEARAHIREKMMNVKLENFTLLDKDGKTVTLASLKGKIVVLDFWASWCAPCKASFPGMKLAVEKYADDPSVAFFFVDTQEPRDGYQEKVLQYIHDHDYPFQVLFDTKRTGGRSNDEVYTQLAKEFHMSGIPQKLVIDKNGYLRFITVGYQGSPTELADEIETMITISKEEA